MLARLFNWLSQHQAAKRDHLWLLTDGTHREVQPTRILNELLVTSPHIRNQTLAVDAWVSPKQADIMTFPSPFPAVAMGAGHEVAQRLLQLKQAHPETAIICFLDPQAQHEQFDVIITPSYEPHYHGEHVIATTGLIPYVSEAYLQDYIKQNASIMQSHWPIAEQKERIFLCIGGKHVGGNITDADIQRILSYLQKKDQNTQLLVCTSKRTENETSQALQQQLNTLTCDVLFYDYRYGRDKPNPYDWFMAHANSIIVTGDSVRMMSEACSSGKHALIYTSDSIHFSYQSLQQELFSDGYAYPLNHKNLAAPYPTKTLHEAANIAAYLTRRYPFLLTHN